MALTGVLRPAYIQVRVLDMSDARKHYIDSIGLNLVSEEADGRVYLRAFDEFDRHSIILREADAPGCDLMAFKVASDVDLDTFEKRLKAYGVAVDHVAAGEQPGVGRRIGFMLPSGHRIELVADMEMSDQHPPVTNPDIWRKMPHGMKATRFDHALFYGPAIDETRDLLAECLDFKLAEHVPLPDGSEMAIWMTCGMKAHDIAFVRHEVPGKLHHVSFFLESWHDVGAAADIITVNDISIDVGPTRHGITRGQTIYFFDPSGNRNEVFAGGYTYYPDNPTRTWTMDELGKGIFYYERKLNDAFLSVLT